MAASNELADLALESIGYHGAEHDDNPVLTLLDKLSDDMRVLQLALDCEDADDVHERCYLASTAVERFIGRVSVIRLLHVQRTERRVTQ